MGLFFRKRPAAPSFPQGDQRALRFPVTPPPERIIEPERVKEAAGIIPRKPVAAPPQMKVKAPEQEMPMPPSHAELLPEGPLYLKVDAYQCVLGELDSLKGDLNDFREVSHTLEKSELNEESRFSDLKKMVRAVHDRLLEVDGLLFKTER
ncbi:MAG TPA: hypothetical protein VJC21_00545 [Candidatus Nanoarchaeia archaeon]|nr:hypothetical protein [Candidatus Nanoarchaeia archaeon]